MAFKKGESGNPGGKPAGLTEWRRGPAAAKMREASHFLLMEMVGSGYVSYRHPESPDVLSYKEVEPRDRLAAAKELLDRVDGKPAQSVSIDSEDVGGAAISIVFPDLSGNAGKTG